MPFTSPFWYSYDHAPPNRNGGWLCAQQRWLVCAALLVWPSFIAHMNYRWIRVTSCRINHTLSALLIPSLWITIFFFFFGWKVNIPHSGARSPSIGCSERWENAPQLRTLKMRGNSFCSHVLPLNFPREFKFLIWSSVPLLLVLPIASYQNIETIKKKKKKTGRICRGPELQIHLFFFPNFQAHCSWFNVLKRSQIWGAIKQHFLSILGLARVI